MADKVTIVENYSEGLKTLHRHVDIALRASGFDTSSAAIHGLIEVAASAASATGCDFEDFVRLAICAWDCHHERAGVCRIEGTSINEAN